MSKLQFGSKISLEEKQLQMGFTFMPSEAEMRRRANPTFLSYLKPEKEKITLFGKTIEMNESDEVPKYSMMVDCSMLPVTIQPRDETDFVMPDQPEVIDNTVLFRTNMPFLRPILVDGLGVSTAFNANIVDRYRQLPRIFDERASEFQVEAVVRTMFYWISEGHKTTLILPARENVARAQYSEFIVSKGGYFGGISMSDIPMFLKLRDSGLNLIRYTDEERFNWLANESHQLHAIVVADTDEWPAYRNLENLKLNAIKMVDQQIAIPGHSFVSPFGQRAVGIFRPYFVYPGDDHVHVHFPPNAGAFMPDVSQYRHLKVRLVGDEHDFNLLERNQLTLVEQLRQMRFLYSLLPQNEKSAKEKHALEGLISRVLPVLTRDFLKMKMYMESKN